MHRDPTPEYPPAPDGLPSASPDGGTSVTVDAPPVQSRKRGKCMTRRTGQNPKVRVKKRSSGQKCFYFQYWIDVPGQEDRRRKTHVIGPTNQMTKSEAERKKVEFLLNQKLNSTRYEITKPRLASLRRSNEKPLTRKIQTAGPQRKPSPWCGSSEQILLNHVGCEARKTPAVGVVFFLDFSL